MAVRFDMNLYFELHSLCEFACIFLNFMAKSSDRTFKSLDGVVSGNIVQAVRDMGFETMTEIQYAVIPHMLSGKDVIAAAKTGSGKTLAFLIPVIELLSRDGYNPNKGVGAIILSPTRELSIQTLTVLQELLKDHPFLSCGLVMGGTNRKDEAAKLLKGINILVATPGRLLDHIQNTAGFNCKSLSIVVLDEADRILDIGFEDDVRSIFRHLPNRKRQVVFFSATMSTKVNELAKFAMQGRDEPLYISTDDKSTNVTVDSLVQGYVIVPADKRFLLLFTFLKKNKEKKIIVFFSSCMSVKFHNELLHFIDLENVYCIHGRQKQAKRTATFFEFCNAEKGVLLCTDVAARGLDIPAVHWIIQYDPPDDPKEYVHRVGRTARAGASGHALLVITVNEVGLLRYLRLAGVPINEFEFSWSKIADIQSDLEELMKRNYFLHMSAREAYKAYVRAYASHSLKDVYDISKLDLKLVAKTFGFVSPPFVDLSVHQPSKQKQKKASMKRKRMFDVFKKGSTKKFSRF